MTINDDDDDDDNTSLTTFSPLYAMARSGVVQYPAQT